MKKRTFDIIVMLSAAILFITLYALDYSKFVTQFIFIIVSAFYLLGQYAERKFKK